MNGIKSRGIFLFFVTLFFIFLVSVSRFSGFYVKNNTLVGSYSIKYSQQQNKAKNNFYGIFDEYLENYALDYNSKFFFMQNKGQIFDKTVFYYAQSPLTNVYFGESKVHFIQNLKPNKEENNKFFLITISFPDSNIVVPQAKGVANYFSNFFYKDKVITQISCYQEIIYEDIYPGISLRYYFTGSFLKYEFIVEPNVDPSVIKVQLSSDSKFYLKQEDKTNIVGISRIGNTEYRIFNDRNLKVFQEGKIIPAYFSLDDNCYNFNIEQYDTAKKLIIDPYLVDFSSYLSGDVFDYGRKIEIGNDGNIYIFGDTMSTSLFNNFAFGNISDDDYDAFVTKLDGETLEPIFTTIIGGSDAEYFANGKVFSNGSVFITGTTRSDDFPTKNAFNSTYGGGSFFDVYLSYINSTGNGLIYSTYLGGKYNDYARGIAIDSDGFVYITGVTNSTDFPTKNAYDNSSNGNYDVFITKFNFTGRDIVYSTFIGSSDFEMGQDIVVNDNGDVYIAGITNSTDFPIKNALAFTISGNFDIFILKLSNTGTELIHSTFLGGEDLENVYSITLDSQDNIYVAGYTTSADFPTKNAYDDTLNGYSDIFLTKISSTADNIIYSTFLGGSSNDTCLSITVDNDQNVYLTGGTWSNDFPIKNAIEERNPTYNSDIFVSMLNKSGTDLIFSTYFGGREEDVGRDIAVDNDGSICIVGSTESSDLLLKNSLNSTLEGYIDAFIIKLVRDSDNDKMPDYWEVSVGLDPDDPSDADGDLDSDGMTNYWEYYYGLDVTNPIDAYVDFDNDELYNIHEFENNTDPRNNDTDFDGLLDGDEIYAYGTDPTNDDTDNDGIDDGVEVLVYGTNPTLKDSDLDGLSDNLEIFMYSTDPLDCDSDNDGLLDGSEVHDYHTNPLNEDTDGDNLNDFLEVMVYGTNPFDTDSDDDGLDDAEEVIIYSTNPKDPDTDGDGMSDYEEVMNNFDPLTYDSNFTIFVRSDIFLKITVWIVFIFSIVLFEIIFRKIQKKRRVTETLEEIDVLGKKY
ncbi:MAG: SBBP repeat-containing protein [Candidatus Heimdallarchaeum endolithica]|uniref:SBBP repeat-containing protein n=1 Tax=Candidatus Heimdallarchaeum endolithica TaxID=2876572 RepID=A0A9Y1FNQ5_9ARCH|nr:MAG: SBBP repeat-containing protein [Candidatus Heimdallarchaeum endolithica]